MYLGGIIVLGTNIIVTIVVIVAAVLFWRAGYFKDIEEPKHRMMQDDEGPITNDP
jgi:nitrogen fixation-related uncharacterized protein